jgi:basic membrane protein A
MGQIVGENYVTAPIWNWAVFYRETLRAIHEGTWTPDSYWPGLASGVVDLSAWGPRVPRSIVAKVREAREELIAGDRQIWADTAFADVSDRTLFSDVTHYVDAVAGTVPE